MMKGRDGGVGGLRYGGGGGGGGGGDGDESTQPQHGSRKHKLLPSPLEAVALAVSKLEDPGGHQPPVSPRPFSSRTTSPRNISPKTPKTASTAVPSSFSGVGNNNNNNNNNQTGGGSSSDRSSGRSTAQISPKDVAAIPAAANLPASSPHGINGHHHPLHHLPSHPSKDTLDDVDAVPLLKYDEEPRYSPRVTGTVFEYPPLLENSENNI